MLKGLILQRSELDCGLCCIAMATGVSYEEALAAAGADFDPDKGLRSEQGALTRLGLSSEYRAGEPVGDFICRHRGPLAPEFFRAFAWGRRALLTVPSLNREDSWHMVYWNGEQLFDPSQGLRYCNFAQLRPEEITLFREGWRPHAEPAP